MKTTLHFPLVYKVEFEGKRYRLNPYFDTVLKVFAIQKEADLTERDKTTLSVSLLIKGKAKLLPGKQIALLNVVYDVLINTPANNYGGQQIVDFEQDSGYIFSSFLADYGIDLYDRQGKLHWWKFIQLFQGLSEKTKIVQVMQVRAKPIPAPTKHNTEERLNLMKLKSQYALHFTEAEREKNLATGLKRLAGLMQGMAEEAR